MASSSPPAPHHSSPKPPDLLIGWTGNMLSNRNFGAWVLEHPTAEQLHVFQAAGFDLSQAGFAPPALMEAAGATYHPNRRASKAIKAWLFSNPPPLLIGLTKEQRTGVWVLHYPSPAQLKIFTDAGHDLAVRRFLADAHLMELAGAVRHPDMNVVPEVVSVFFAPPTMEERVGVNLFGWPRTGGVWALLAPTAGQLDELREGGYDFGTYDSEDRWHGLLEKVGARWYADPSVVKDEVEKVSPNMELQERGTRGGIAA